MTTTHETKLFDTELGKIEIIVGYRKTVVKHPIRLEECHGRYPFNEDEETIELTSVEIVIPHASAPDILPLLTEKQKEYIINQLND